MKSAAPDRISLSEIVKTIKPVMSKATFYGSKEKPGPRWTEVDRLDIRCGRRITADRQCFERWYRQIQGQLASTPHEIAARLGGRSRRTTSDGTYGEQLAALCTALEHGAITRQQFEYALATLPSAA